MNEEDIIIIPVSDQWVENGELYWKGDLLTCKIKKCNVDLAKNKLKDLRFIIRWGLHMTGYEKSPKAEIVSELNKYIRFQEIKSN